MESEIVENGTQPETKPDLRVSQEFAQKVVDYLATRPYAEVFEMIQGFMQLETLEE